MAPQTNWKASLKQAVISILIGTAISILTVLFQALTGWLTEVKPEVPGVLLGIAKYLHSWSSNLRA